MEKEEIKLESTIYANQEDYDELRHQIIENKCIRVIMTTMDYDKERGEKPYRIKIFMEVEY